MERKITIGKTDFTWKNPKTRKNHEEKRGCTSLSEKDYNGAIITYQEFDCFSPSFSLEEKGYLYKSRDDVELASISGGCNHTIFMVVTTSQL